MLSLTSGLIQRSIRCEIINITKPTASGRSPIEIEAERRGLPVRSINMRAGPSFAGAVRLMHESMASGVHLLHTHGYKPTFLLAGIPRAFRKIPVVSTVHGQLITTPFSRQWLYQRAGRLALRNADRVIAVSQDMYDKGKFDTSYGWRAGVIRNGIDLAQEADIVHSHSQQCIVKQIREFIKDGWPILSVGRLSREKGFDSAIRVLKRLQDSDIPARLVIAGEGPQRTKLTELALDLGVSSRVFFAGYVHGVYRLMGLFKILLMPSHTEGIPIALLEALAAGLPPVATAVGGIPEVVDPAIGVLVRVGDEDRMSGAINDLFRNPGQLDACRRQCKSRAVEFSVSRMVESYIETYKSVI